ncbi:MAG: type II secretion system protein [Candidatus Saccharimonadaceae bacterium]|nr:type II secretion system protein [Candidatus Saccharimonadaceae bacterium]
MNTKNKEGFTIIEVVLVLAIAGLIFMMVFIALPALQRSQRDTQRKNDLSRAMTAVNNYQGANRGVLPSQSGGLSWGDFEIQYLETNGDSFQDPSGSSNTHPSDYYEFADGRGFDAGQIGNFTKGDGDNQNVIYYDMDAVCGTGGAISAGAGSRKVALRIVLEGGGIYCVNN